MNVLGVDLSLTATGVALPDGTTLTLTSKNTGMQRLADIRHAVLMAAPAVDLVVLEGYAWVGSYKGWPL